MEWVGGKQSSSGLNRGDDRQQTVRGTGLIYDDGLYFDL